MLVLCMPRKRFRAFLDQENSSPQNWGFRDGIPNSLPIGGMGSLTSAGGRNLKSSAQGSIVSQKLSNLQKGFYSSLKGFYFSQTTQIDFRRSVWGPDPKVFTMTPDPKKDAIISIIVEIGHFGGLTQKLSL